MILIQKLILDNSIMKYFLLKKQLFFLILLGLSITSFAQKDSLKVKSIKPLRIGVKVGLPIILTANAEYVTPLLNNRVAIAVDFMSLSKTVDDVSVDYTNFEIGTNIYFSKKGKGLYAGFSYFSFDSVGNFSDVEFDDGSIQDGTANIDFNTINLKLGAKLGRTFYFRIEVGYGFGDIPQEVVVTSSSGLTIIEEIPKVKGISSTGLPIFNFGIGFSFL